MAKVNIVPILLNDPSELDKIAGGSTIQYNCKKCGKLVERIFWPYRKEQCLDFLCKSCKIANKNIIGNKIVYTKENPIFLTDPSELNNIKGGSWFKFACQECGKCEIHEYWPFRYNLFSKFLCKKHKTEMTNVQIYGRKYNVGTPESIAKAIITHRNKTPEEKAESFEKRKQTCFEMYGEGNYFDKEKRLKLNIERYGGPSPFSDPKIQNKAKETIMSKYSVDNAFKVSEIREKSRQTHIKKYGVDSYSKTEEGRKLVSDMTHNHLDRNAHYKYKDNFFDSTWELAFWIYCEDNEIPIKRVTEPFIFEYNGENWHKYTPDFIINDKEYVEIKGEWLGFGKNDKQKYNEARKQCAINHHVKIYEKKDIKNILEYIEYMYGKDYFDNFKLEKMLPDCEISDFIDDNDNRFIVIRYPFKGFEDEICSDIYVENVRYIKIS